MLAVQRWQTGAEWKLGGSMHFSQSPMACSCEDCRVLCRRSALWQIAQGLHACCTCHALQGRQVRHSALERGQAQHLDGQEALLHEGHNVVHMHRQLVPSRLEQQIGLIDAALCFAPYLLHVLLVLLLDVLDLHIRSLSGLRG